MANRYYYRFDTSSALGKKFRSFWNECNKAERAAEVFAKKVGAVAYYSSPSAFAGGVAAVAFEEGKANENPSKEKVEVKEVEGRKNFNDKVVITPLPAIMIATWDENENPDVMMAAWGGQCGPKHITFELSKHKTTDNIRLKQAFTISFATKGDIV